MVFIVSNVFSPRWKFKSVEALLSNNVVPKCFKPAFQAALVDARHQFTAFSQQESPKRAYRWKTECSRRWCSVIGKDRQRMTVPKMGFHGASCNTLDGIVLSKFKLLVLLRVDFSFAKLFEIKYHFRSCEAKTGNFEEYSKVSNFLLDASVATCLCHICTAKTMRSGTTSSKLVLDENFGRYWGFSY